tara:strand:- start:1188 stop:1997 length:810 start_codon:yes stop_codon:yes gene_type:complete
MDLKNIVSKSYELRKKIIDIIYKSGKGHFGGALSCIDLILALYYGGFIFFNKIANKNSNFILSKGHAAIALYVVLNDLGLIEDNVLSNMNQGSIIGEHPDHQVPGIDVIAGSLGHGLGIGIGRSVANKLDNSSLINYVLMGDGECSEGSVWEAVNFAGKIKLNNIITIIDNNGLGILEQKSKLKPETNKKVWEGFGWHVTDLDGHDIFSIIESLNFLTTSNIDKPKVIIANTLKGKGISFMEDKLEWHHGSLSEELYNQAIKDLEIYAN